MAEVQRSCNHAKKIEIKKQLRDADRVDLYKVCLGKVLYDEEELEVVDIVETAISENPSRLYAKPVKVLQKKP